MGIVPLHTGVKSGQQMKSVLKQIVLTRVPPALSNLLLPRLAPSGNPFHEGILESRVIFIHVPKAAGSSVKTELYGSPRYGHRQIAEFRAYDRRKTAAFFKFAFVRNPWDRLLSAHAYLTEGEGANSRDRRFARQILAPKGDFQGFVHALENPAYARQVMAYDHFRPQGDWICLPGQSSHAMDFLGRFERFEDDMAVVRNKLGRPARAAERVRLSKHGDWQAAYTPRMRDIAARLYAADIALLGYPFHP